MGVYSRSGRCCARVTAMIRCDDEQVEIYNRFNSTKYLYSEINIDDCMNHNVSLSSEDAEFIDFILENYLKYSGAELERLSHNEMPWIETRGDLNVNERCDKVITPELMIEYSVR